MEVFSHAAKRAALWLIVGASLALSGCAHKLHFNCGDTPQPDGKKMTYEQIAAAENRYDLDGAMGCVTRLRTDMQAKVERLDTTLGAARVGTLLGGLAAAGGALYGAHRDFVVGGTAVGFGSYTAGNLYAPAPVMTVYHNGIEATRCVSSIARGAAASVAQIKERRVALETAVRRLGDRCPNGICSARGTPPAITAPTATAEERIAEAASSSKTTSKGGRDTGAPAAGAGQSTDKPVDKPVSSSAPAGGSSTSAAPSSAIERDPAVTFEKGWRLLVTSRSLLSQQPLGAKIVEAAHKIADTVDRQVADHTPSLDAFLSASQDILSAARASVPPPAPTAEKTEGETREAFSRSRSLSAAEIEAIDAVESAAAMLEASIKSFGDASALGNDVGECAKVTTVTIQPLTIRPANTEIALGKDHTISVDGGLKPYRGDFVGSKPDTGEILWSRTSVGEFRFEKKGEIKRDYTFLIRDSAGGDKAKEVTLVFKASK